MCVRVRVCVCVFMCVYALAPYTTILIAQLSDLMFHNERTMSQNKDDLSLGEDLLVSIRESLSQASAHNLKLSSVSQPAPNDQMVGTLSLKSLNFIYGGGQWDRSFP